MIWKSFALLCLALCSAEATSPSAKTTSSLRGRGGVDEKKTKSYRDNATYHSYQQKQHHQRSRILEEDVHGTYLLVSYVSVLVFNEYFASSILFAMASIFTPESVHHL